jgi:hypothetical protein
MLYPVQGLTFSYNTFIGNGYGVLFRDADSSDPGAVCSNYNVSHNIFTSPTVSGTAVNAQPNSAACGGFDYNVSQDPSATGRNSIVNWTPKWADTTWYQELGLPFQSGDGLTS